MKTFLKKLGVVAALAAVSTLGAMAQSAPDATTIATGANSAFNVVAPIVIAIATFFVVVRIAKRVVK